MQLTSLTLEQLYTAAAKAYKAGEETSAFDHAASAVITVLEEGDVKAAQAKIQSFINASMIEGKPQITRCKALAILMYG